ncbi:acyl carrier protein [Streptomyces sp. NPDC001388]|uniref:acyl carrier protein n=1 Tax=unclassified Streptomyces TaxID=2593676 RepID=UPI0036967B5C
MSPGSFPHPSPTGTELRKDVRAAWAAALEHEAFTDDEDFFDAGGHSLLVARIMADLGKAVGRRLPLRLFFDHPTVADLSDTIEAILADDGGEPR